MGVITVNINVEVDDRYTHRVDVPADDFLHEALCRAIHEGDPKSLELLNTYVTNITLTERR